ncbi:MAG: hypothetical protein MHMPM18_004175 [Marteilia pararefringens]
MSDCKKLQKNEAAAAAKRPKVEQEESPPKHQRTILQFDEPTRSNSRILRIELLDLRQMNSSCF